MDAREVASRVDTKMDELGGLVTQEGAAFIVARELGLELFKSEPRSHDLKVENVIPGMTSVDIVGKAVKVYPLKEFKKKDGTQGTMGSLIMGDETGMIRVVLWDKASAMLADIPEDSVIRIKNGYTKANQNGEPEIHIKSTSRVTVNPDDVEPGDIKPRMTKPRASATPREATERYLADLKDGDRANIRGALIELYDPKVFQRKDGRKGIVVNAAIDDGTACMRAAFYDKQAEALLEAQLSGGDDMEDTVSKAYEERKSKIIGREVIASVDVRHSDFSGQDELVVQSMVINPDPKEIIKGMLEEMKLEG